ncbi:hypothetical protein [Bradyrhizobium sp. RP6]|uniref:hypothetical protein n=1 Tax=Bradyrhizobium sp. RP6 TaxID=2489596 RepID=UPI000F544B4E|nr:hypothetical protein [Bradyrhizobium sp. RP6]RQH15711.1 hypothetical protein EHH60_00490 [Bradyrhizobium sp. RP6]
MTRYAIEIIGAGEGNRTLVFSLEGFQRLNTSNVHSDKYPQNSSLSANGFLSLSEHKTGVARGYFLKLGIKTNTFTAARTRAAQRATPPGANGRRWNLGVEIYAGFDNAIRVLTNQAHRSLPRIKGPRSWPKHS